MTPEHQIAAALFMGAGSLITLGMVVALRLVRRYPDEAITMKAPRLPAEFERGEWFPIDVDGES